VAVVTNIQVLSVNEAQFINNEAQFINIFWHLPPDQRRADLRTIGLHNTPAVSALMDIEPRATKRTG
jgi:hypothetical protein